VKYFTNEAGDLVPFSSNQHSLFRYKRSWELAAHSSRTQDKSLIEAAKEDYILIVSRVQPIFIQDVKY
jgi:hypothetical protein